MTIVTSAGESFDDLGSLFGVSHENARDCANRIFDTALEDAVLTYFINFPEGDALQRTMAEFEKRTGGLRGIVGAIDGSHIPILSQRGYRLSSRNRKSQHSTILQV